MDVAFCSLDMNTMELQYAGAYNPLYVIRKNDRGKEIKPDDLTCFIIFTCLIGGTFGAFVIPLTELAEQPIKRGVKPIIDEKPVQTITLAANIKFA